MDKPHAIRLADALDQLYKTPPSVTDAAIELRRLHQSEQEGWRWARECETEVKRLKDIIDELENDDLPKRQWQDLTNEEVWACLPEVENQIEFARAIEQRLKEKNK